jgi:eukaryotic-like serine/threonine-protein kinase
MLAKEPAARPSTEDVACALEEPQTPRQALRLWQWALGVAALIATCFTVWWWLGREDRNRSSFRQITTLVPENRATAAAISPDGKLAAYANIDGIFIREIDGGNARPIAAPSDFATNRLAWFSDERNLVASGFSNATHIPGIWMVSVTGAAPHLLRTHARSASPSPDGMHIMFITQDQSEIWTMAANGEEPHRVVSGLAGDAFMLAFWSPDGRRVAFQRVHYSPQQHAVAHRLFDRFYVRSYESVDLTTGKLTASEPDIGISAAAALKDGRLLFLRYQPHFVETADQLWEVKTDLATGRFIESPYLIANPVDQPATDIYGMSTTTDGKRVMVLRRSDQDAVFVGDFDKSLPKISNIRRLTFDERASYPHAWTSDSHAVIFESNRNKTWDLFKQDIKQYTPEPIVATSLAEVLPHTTPDSHWILYSAGPKIAHGAYKLMRVPVEGGVPEAVSTGGLWEEIRCPLGRGKWCVLRTSITHEYYVFYQLDPVRGRGRELTRTRWAPGVTEDWDISPDGTQVAIPNHSAREARIRLVAMEPAPNAPRERELVLEGLSGLRSLVWAADGSGWFVSVDTTIGNRLLYVYLDGRYRSLGDIQGWAVPAPDGRRVAFLDRTIATNAWLIERH